MREQNHFSVGVAHHNIVHRADAYLVRELPDQRGFFVAVADGLSSVPGSEVASLRVVNLAWTACVEEYGKSIWEIYQRLRRLLATTRQDVNGQGGATTLSVGLLRKEDGGSICCEYLAVGDSPIVHCYRGPLAEELPGTFLSGDIHARPRQYLNAGYVYALVNCDERGIKGRANIGKRYIDAGDIIIIATDGLPMESYLFNDIRVGGESHVFLNEIANGRVQERCDELFRMIEENGDFTDDATMVVVKVENGEYMEKGGSAPVVGKSIDPRTLRRIRRWRKNNKRHTERFRGRWGADF